MLVAADGALDRLVTPARSSASRGGAGTPARHGGGLVCPVGASISSDWGDPRDGGARTHQGIDLAHAEGAPIVAPFNARVVDTIDVEADGGLGGISLWLEATDGPHKGAAVYVAHNRRNLVRAPVRPSGRASRWPSWATPASAPDLTHMCLGRPMAAPSPTLHRSVRHARRQPRDSDPQDHRRRCGGPHPRRAHRASTSTLRNAVVVQSTLRCVRHL